MVKGDRPFDASENTLISVMQTVAIAAEVLKKAVPSLSEQQVEDAGIYMAKNRDVFAKAFKSQPDALSELLGDESPAE